MESVSVLSVNEKFVASEVPCRQYSIVFDGCNQAENSTSCVIPVKNRREVELLLLILGEEAGVIFNNEARLRYPDVWEWLNERTYLGVFDTLKWSFREEEEVLNLIEKIPLPTDIHNSFLKMHVSDPEPPLIPKNFVHKTHSENVLISEPYKCGNIYYFNGFSKSPEFNIDHYSDHLEGIIMFEVARQAGNASAHLAGMPFEGSNVILKTHNRYTKFIEADKPYLIRTIPAYKHRGGVGYCVFNIIQNGNSCVSGYFSVISYNNRDIYNKFRNSKLINRASNAKEIG